ncbi:DUF6191 domain-containing protein [Nocardia sp. NPDC059177]|uniref:DUF6191 domain-containing protein n=1 Tax=Nocardia sp. NPDC059177 TaxID=3346759 RepID=UPI00367D428C
MDVALYVGTFAAVVVGIDQLGLWAERRGWVHWRKTRRSGSAGGGMLATVDEVFNPASRHTVEERESRQLVRVDIGDGRELDLSTRPVYLRPGPGRIRP